MTLLRRHLSSSIAIAFAAGSFACGGEKLTLPGEGQPTKIEMVTGDKQAGIAGTVLPLQLVVKVTDELGRPVSGQNVEYTVTAGGGQVSPSSFQTGADGRASVTWTLGLNAGEQGVQAQAVGGGAPDNLIQPFTATAIAGSGSLIAAVSGDDQSAPVSSALGQPLIARVSDANGNPVSGITIRWTVQNGGSITPETVVTGDDGLASASRVLGPSAGQQSAQASGDGLAGSPVTFVQTAVASNPTALTYVSGNGQTAPAGFEVAQDLVVKLTDDNGNGVGGQQVAWIVPAAGGTVNPATSTTDPTGLARTRWTLGGSAGQYTLNASFSGLLVPFTATASADVPATLAIASGDNQTAAAGAELPAPLAVKVTDANNNPVANVSVAWTANGGATVSAGTSATDVAGIARVTLTLGPALTNYATTAEVAGLAGSPVTFTSTATVGAAAKIVIITPPPATAVNGAQFAPQPVVQVQDAAGNNVGPAGRVITASILNPPPGSPLKGDLSKDTDANGLAVFTDLSILGPAQTYTLRFRSGALAEARADVMVTVGPPTSIAIQSGDNQSGAVGQALDNPLSVKVTDATNNPVENVTVAWTANGGGSVSAASSVTNALGIAQIIRTLGATPGAYTTTAAVTGLTGSPLTFTSTATAGVATKIVIITQPGPTAANGSPLAPQPVVQVQDAAGNNVGPAGRVITASLLNPLTGASLNGDTSKDTDANGQAVFTDLNVTGPVATYTIRFQSAALAEATADVSVTVGDPASMAIQAGDGQSAPAGTAVPINPAVSVTDAGGNPVSGVDVTFAPASGGGSVGGGGIATTDGAGIATVASWTLGSTMGANTLTATIAASGISGNPVTFTATAQ